MPLPSCYRRRLLARRFGLEAREWEVDALPAAEVALALRLDAIERDCAPKR